MRKHEEKREEKCKNIEGDVYALIPKNVSKLTDTFLLRFHSKHSGKRQMKARGYSGRKEFKQRSLIYERVQSKEVKKN